MVVTRKQALIRNVYLGHSIRLSGVGSWKGVVSNDELFSLSRRLEGFDVTIADFQKQAEMVRGSRVVLV